MIKLKIDPLQIDDLAKELRELPRAAMSPDAVNDAAAHGAERLRVRVGNFIGFPAARLQRAILTVKAGKRHIAAKIRLLSFRFPLIGTDKTPAQGQAYALDANGEPQTLTNEPFKQVMLDGRIGWFVRVGIKRLMGFGRHTGKARQPVKQIFSDSAVSAVQKRPDILAAETEAVADEAERKILAQIDRMLK